MSKRDLNKVGKEEKVTALLEDIDLNLIQEIELDADKEGIVDAGKIKSKALQHAKETLENQKAEVGPVINMKERKLKKKRGFKRSILIPLVAILSLIGAAIASTGLNSTLNNFFGELFPYENQVQVVGKEQVKSGIIYTVEGAFIDNKSGLFIVSMKKEDDSKFEKDNFVQNIRLDMDKPSSKGWNTQTYLEDEDKKLVTVMDLSSSKNLYNQKLTLSAENIIKYVEDQQLLEINLNEMYENNNFEVLSSNAQTWYNYDRKEGLNLHLAEGIKDFSIDDMRLTDKGFSILTSYKEPAMAVGGTLVNLALVDIRTGSIYEGERHTNWENENKLTKNAFVFENVTADDLPYLQVKYNAQYEKMVVEGKWEIILKLSKNSQVISKHILNPVKLTDKHVLFTQVEVSALGVTLRGYGRTGNTTNLSVKVMMKDGEEIAVTNSGSSYNGRLIAHYNLGTNENSHIPNLIKIEDVVGIKINDKVIKMHH